ncbi:hypothetical protein [Pseudomonas pseudonitroreducens]|uniref:hypothetical protein n=1 Tax=Pseudomonas pseudonitroreducens TaxID=2892326 RepID=UPI001F2D201A|nr:hypothetical protein [Pseudomonas pseudonitroreducens]
MSLTFFTSKPQQLLNAFNEKIEQEEPAGKITTWERSDDKAYYTHKAKDWTKKAWFKPSVQEGKLVFNIIKPQNMNVTALVYAYYHGHLTETFLNHFDKSFTSAQSSALPTTGDLVSNPKK